MLWELLKPPTLFQSVWYGTLSWNQLCEFSLWHLCVFGFLHWPWNKRLKGVKTSLRALEINYIRMTPLTLKSATSSLMLILNDRKFSTKLLQSNTSDKSTQMIKVVFFSVFLFPPNWSCGVFGKQLHLVSKPLVPVKAGQQEVLLSSSLETTSLTDYRSSSAPCWSGVRWVYKSYVCLAELFFVHQFFSLIVAIQLHSKKRIGSREWILLTQRLDLLGSFI